MSANDTQIDGNHYKSQYQHWDFVIDAELNYLQGCATKYLSRARFKHGSPLVDYQKAKHYTLKLIETTLYGKGVFSLMKNAQLTYHRSAHAHRFIHLSKMNNAEKSAFLNICSYTSSKELEQAVKGLDELIESCLGKE